MKFFLSFFSFLFIAIFLEWQILFAFGSEIEIINADEVWTSDIETIPNEAVDSTNASVKLPNDAVVCHADEVWNYGFEPVSQDVSDSTDASLKLPDEAAVCHADEVWSDELVSVDIGSDPTVDTKTPVLFVSGLLGTEMFKGDTRLWASILRMINPLNSDDFMDPLKFKNTLLPDDPSVFYGSVLTNPDGLYDYTQGLIGEFAKHGYVEGKDFFMFPYDWRYGVSGVYPGSKTNSVLLKEAIDHLAENSPAGKVDVIAHSLGGLIAKKYIIENENPKINKLVYVGVPNLGLPTAAETLLAGNDFGIIGLNPKEMKKISQNMPAAYDLLPSELYFTKRDGYLRLRPFGENGANFQLLKYGETMVHIGAFGGNYRAVSNADILHSTEFDLFDAETKGVKAYNIVGCKSGTFYGLLDYQDDSLIYGNYFRDRKYINGDDTVPFESADSIPVDDNKSFYLPLANHGRMPSQDGARQMIASIIAGGEVPPQIISHIALQGNPDLCRLDGDIIEIHSPVEITITDKAGNIVLGPDGQGNIHYDIPGANFEIDGGRKYVYLPSEYKNRYNINLKGSGAGTFTLVDKKIDGDEVISAQAFNDIPVVPTFNGSLIIGENTTQIISDGGPVLNPTSEIGSGATGDIVPPRTSVLINGAAIKEFYSADAAISLAADDFSQDGASPAGVFSTSYVLDGQAAATYENTITVSAEGKHTLVFFSGDKLGNKEEPKSISFAVDKTAPEMKFSFDQTGKDLAFFATDNYSASSTISIIDQNGAVSATDQAGNETKLLFGQKNRKQSLRAQISGLLYNGKAVDLRGSQLAFAWFYGYTPKLPLLITGLQSLPAIPAKLPQTGVLTFLLQQAKLKDGSFVVALFGNNKTLVLEYKKKKLNLKTFTGLKLINFATDKGKLSWSY